METSTGQSDTRTPPEIVVAAPVPADALEVFIMQELERWGFDVGPVGNECVVKLPRAGGPGLRAQVLVTER